VCDEVYVVANYLEQTVSLGLICPILVAKLLTANQYGNHLYDHQPLLSCVSHSILFFFNINASAMFFDRFLLGKKKTTT